MLPAVEAEVVFARENTHAHDVAVIDAVGVGRWHVGSVRLGTAGSSQNEPLVESERYVGPKHLMRINVHVLTPRESNV